MSSIDQLPKIIKRNVDRDDVKASVVGQIEKPFILCATREVLPQEVELIRSYGKVFIFEEAFRNIPIASHDFAYAFFDLRRKVDRDALMKEDLSAYYVIAIIDRLDKLDDTHKDIGALNLVHSLPSRQAFKADFDRLLLSAKIRAPSTLKSLWRFLCFLSGGSQNE